MKKILKIALVAFLVMVISVWSIGWFMQARAIKKEILNAIALDPELGTAKAADITVGGFPLKMIVTVTDPSMSVHFNKWLSATQKRVAAATGNSAGVLTAPEYPEATLATSTKGYARVTLNAFSDVLDLELNGNQHMQLVQPSGTLSLDTEYSGPTTCQVKLKRNASTAITQMWNLDKFKDYAVLEEMRSLNCSFAGAIITNSDTGQVVGSMEPGSIAFTNESTEATRKGALTINIKSYEIMPEGDAAINQLITAFTPVGQASMPVSASLYGKQTILLDGNAEFSANRATLGDAPFHFEIKQIYFTSAAGTMNGSTLIQSKPEGTRQKGEISFSYASEFRPAQTELAKVSVNQFAEEIYKNPKLGQAAPTVDRATFEAAAFDALPNITQLGPITMKQRFVFDVDKTTREGSLSLSGLEFSSRDYGILADGSGSMAKDAAPIINATILCKNCTAMIDTMAAYANRVQAAAKIAAANVAPFAWSQEEVEGVKKLLVAVGTAENNVDLKYVIEGKQEGMTINGRPIMEVMMLAQQYLPQAPASASPPAPPVELRK